MIPRPWAACPGVDSQAWKCSVPLFQGGGGSYQTLRTSGLRGQASRPPQVCGLCRGSPKHLSQRHLRREPLCVTGGFSPCQVSHIHFWFDVLSHEG